MLTHSRIWVLPLAAVTVCQPAHALVYMSVERAQQLMFREQTLTPLALTLSPADIAAIERDCGVKVYSATLQAWKAQDGYFFVDAVIGKHG